ncbi:MAG TPA: class I SAM-dependent methyltransferase [Pyrinomonadaceae bacterium]|nr:class I SAM-dependent methyltransferase [Pyrinomonadaceae bacterium]
MSITTYKEFEWRLPKAGNGESGVRLTNLFLDLVKGLENVKTICDLGCGNGYMAGLLAELGYDVVGVDASESGIAIARQNFAKAEFVHSSIDSTLRDKTMLDDFDLVVSSDVIEHFYRPSDLIEAAVSLLKPNGHLLVGTPYHGYLKNLALSVTAKMDAHFTTLNDGGHIKFFSVRTLSQLLRSYHFTNLNFTFYGRAPWLWKNMICHARSLGPQDVRTDHAFNSYL